MCLGGHRNSVIQVVLRNSQRLLPDGLISIRYGGDIDSSGCIWIITKPSGLASSVTCFFRPSGRPLIYSPSAWPSRYRPPTLRSRLREATYLADLSLSDGNRPPVSVPLSALSTSARSVASKSSQRRNQRAIRRNSLLLGTKDAMRRARHKEGKSVTSYFRYSSYTDAEHKRSAQSRE